MKAVILMADVQLENGFTRIANDILEHIINLPLNGTQYKIIILLWRETYGFSRKECKFSDAFIASRLSIRRQNAHAEYKALENAGIIKTTVPPTYSTPRIVSFGKNYDEWVIDGCNAKALQACKSSTGMQEQYSNAEALLTGMQEQYTGVMQKHSHTNKSKKPIKKELKKPNNALLDAFERFYSAYPKKRDKDKALKAFIKIDPDDALVALIMDKLEQFKRSLDWTKDGGQFIPFPSTWLNNKRWNDDLEEVYKNGPGTNRQHLGENDGRAFSLTGFKPADSGG